MKRYIHYICEDASRHTLGPIGSEVILNKVMEFLCNLPAVIEISTYGSPLEILADQAEKEKRDE